MLDLYKVGTLLSGKDLTDAELSDGCSYALMHKVFGMLAKVRSLFLSRKVNDRE